jgi:hypothetical protein
LVVKDERVSKNQYLITNDLRELMQIPDAIRKCVALCTNHWTPLKSRNRSPTQRMSWTPYTM